MIFWSAIIGLNLFIVGLVVALFFQRKSEICLADDSMGFALLSLLSGAFAVIGGITLVITGIVKLCLL